MQRIAVLLFAVCLLACQSEDRDGDAPPRTRAPAPRAESPAGAEEPPEPEPEASPAALDFRLTRIEPDRYVGTRQLCDVRFVEGPLPVGSVTGEPTGTSPVAEERTGPAPATRMNIECASADGDGTWVDLRLPENANPSQVSIGSRVEVEVEDAYGGTANHTVVRFVRRLGLGEAPARDRTAPPDDGFDFTQLRRRPAVLRTEQICRVDFASQLSPVDPRSHERHPYPEAASLRMDLRCLHPGGDSWLDLVFTPEDAEEALRVRRGAEVAVKIVTAQAGFANYPIVRIVAD